MPRQRFDINLNAGCQFMLRLSHCCSLDQADDTRLIPYEVSRIACWDYLDKACHIIGHKAGYPEKGPSQTSLQNDIILQLGQPPLESYSIYIMTISDPITGTEKTVYVGQTNATPNRFREAHAAISVLQSSFFSGMKKSIYFARISAIFRYNEIIPIEWITDPKIRDTILQSIENQLILELRPDLNQLVYPKVLNQSQQSITIQNIVSRFLDAETFGTNRPKPAHALPSKIWHSRIKFWKNNRSDVTPVVSST